MKKALSILLSVAMLISMASLMAISVSADADYTYIVYDNMSGDLNADTGTATTSTDNMIIRVNGGIFHKYASYGGYAVAQWQSNNKNRNLTFELKGVASGKYTLTIGTVDVGLNYRGIYSVAANETQLGTVDFAYPGAQAGDSNRHYVDHEFNTEFSTDGTSNVVVVLTPNAQNEVVGGVTRPSNQCFLYNITLTRTGDYAEPVTSPISTVDGASIRLGVNSGLRFYTSVDFEALEALNTNDDAVELGTLIAPSDLLGDDELTFDLDESNYIDVKYTANEYWNTNQIVASIVNIKEANLARNFVARGYAKIGDKYYYSEETSTRTIAGVASAFIADQNSAYSSLDATTKAIVDHWAAANA